jgi:hypothetical protein
MGLLIERALDLRNAGADITRFAAHCKSLSGAPNEAGADRSRL